MKKTLTFQILDDDDPLDIRKDHIFKAVFTKETKNARGALSKLISALIGRTVSINTIWANEPPVENEGDRKIRFDINCRTEDGERINIEMCFYPKPYEPVRLEFHAARLFTSQEISGTGKTYDNLKQTYQIAILSNQSFFADKEFLHIFEYCDPVHKISLSGRTRIITIELSKLTEIAEKPADEMSITERWAVYFEYLTDRNKRSIINDIIKKEEGISMVNEELMSISRNEAERMRILGEEKYRLDRQSELAYARNEGRDEGITEGRKDGEQYIINLLKSGKTPEEILQDYSFAASS